MQALPLVEKPGGILAFDFDGTMHSPSHQPPVDARLLEWIQFLREKKQSIWGVCTGRSTMHLMEGLSKSVPFLPDFAVTREREIHFVNRFGRFVPDQDWNKKCEKDHKKLFKKTRRELKKVRTYVEEVAHGKWIEEEGEWAGVVLPDAEGMEGVLAEVERCCGGCQDLGYERNGVYLRFSHSRYGKGPALLEIMNRVGLSPQEVIVAGDNFNDMSMFTPQVSACPICPGNSVPEVKEQVRRCQGVVGQSEASTGIVEALEQIFVPKGFALPM